MTDKQQFIADWLKDNPGDDMTDAQKVDALTELLSEVIHCLNMKQWDIEDPTDSYLCEVQADEYYGKMLKILHSEHDTKEKAQ